jgi:hypothetical protein
MAALVSCLSPLGNSRQVADEGADGRDPYRPLCDRKSLCRLAYLRCYPERQRALSEAKKSCSVNAIQAPLAGAASQQAAVCAACQAPMPSRSEVKRGRERPPSSGSPLDPLA